jgi:hypothetical protein
MLLASGIGGAAVIVGLGATSAKATAIVGKRRVLINNRQATQPNAYSACLTPGCANTGPRVAVGPQPSVTCAPSSVNFNSSQSSSTIQSTISGNSPGTSYCFAAGTYTQPVLTPNSGDTYIGVNGAIFDGQTAANYAFSDYYAGTNVTNVTIKNITIQNYAPSAYQGAIYSGRTGSSGWSILNDSIKSSAANGIYTLAPNWSLVGNYIYNNAQGGVELNGADGASSDNFIVTDNEFDSNNLNQSTYPYNSNGCGGIKVYEAKGVTISFNYAHGNTMGLWTDTDNQGVVFDNNDSENNLRPGIMHEISYDAVIQNNYIAGNGTSLYCSSDGIFYCAGIFISNSGGTSGKTVDVSNNKIIAASYGGAVSLLNYTRGSGIFGPWIVQNVHVHNNWVNLSAGGTDTNFGAVDHDGTDPNMFTSQGNSFDYDSFTGAGTSNLFYWGTGTGGSFTNFAGFQGKEQEMHGTSS